MTCFLRYKTLILFAMMSLICAYQNPELNVALAARGSEVLVRVNGVPITAAELDRFVKSFFLDEAQADRWELTSESGRQTIRADALNIMIERQLLLTAAKEKIGESRKIRALVNENVDAMLSEMEEQMGSRINMIRKLHEDGLSLNKWKKHQAEAVMIGTYLSEVTQGIHVRPAEMKEYYRRDKDKFRKQGKIYFQYILLVPEGGENREEVKERARYIKELIEDGRCFVELARQYSYNHDEDEDGLRVANMSEHDRDWRPRPVRGLEPGEVSGINEWGSGFVIGKLEDVSPPGVKAFNEVQNDIRNRMMREKKSDAQQEKINKLREKADIQFTEEGKRLNDEPPEPGFPQFNL